MIESTLKIARYCPLVIQGFSNFLGLFQGIMANPVMGKQKPDLKTVPYIFNIWTIYLRFGTFFGTRGEGLPDILATGSLVPNK